METTKVREIAIKFVGKARSIATEITSPEAAVEFFRALIGQEVREHFVALYLDGRRRPIGWRTISIGTVNQALVHPRETFQAAIALNAASIVVAHNHPSGDTLPSREDWEVTQRLVDAGVILGIEVADHVVIGPKGFASLRRIEESRFGHR